VNFFLFLPPKLLRTAPTIAKINHLRRIGWLGAEQLWRQWLRAFISSWQGADAGAFWEWFLAVRRGFVELVITHIFGFAIQVC
jgi:hypothetical protein